MSYDIKTLSQVGVTNTIEEGDYLLISKGGYLTKLPIVDGGAFTPPSPTPTTSILTVPVTITSAFPNVYYYWVYDSETGQMTQVQDANLPMQVDCPVIQYPSGNYGIILGAVERNGAIIEDSNGVSGVSAGDSALIWFSGATTLPEYITVNGNSSSNY